MTYRVVGINSKGEEVGTIAVGVTKTPEVIQMTKDMNDEINSGMYTMTITARDKGVSKTPLPKDKEVVEIVFIEEEVD